MPRIPRRTQSAGHPPTVRGPLLASSRVDSSPSPGPRVVLSLPSFTPSTFHCSLYTVLLLLLLRSGRWITFQSAVWMRDALLGINRGRRAVDGICFHVVLSRSTHPLSCACSLFPFLLSVSDIRFH
ncbi:hypothetical protein L227DRAFT_436952 [Lentinus tigrinus ALCF2SS1-6]|uniref:Uncharacterized protein n=1 Tax=Lentinus tigrinus ALCF2SS1-6 TaxID=1328759 RepID=A0A5C2SGD2_9APHY|nr:hypothetical protein L227DRAFT_436952 [Lentinus tigrinus ALCF2SS1-6]